MKNYVKSELILEASKGIKQSKGFFKKITKHKLGITETYIKVCDEELAKKIDREVGNYICFDFDEMLFYDLSAKKLLTQKVKEAIAEIVKQNKIKPNKIFVVGLGNENYACDSLGKKVSNGVLVTKPYLDKNLFDSSQMKEIYSVSLGVYGTTGLESSDTIKSICSQIKPDLVIAVDSLVASSNRTLAKSVQISDTKLSPGGGVGNDRKEVSENILKTKVLAIGVPLVVNLSSETNGLIVTPKDVEIKVKTLSKIISKAINLSFTKLSEKEYLELTT